MGHTRPLFLLFLSFKTLQFLQHLYVKMSIQYTVLAFEPTTFSAWKGQYDEPKFSLAFVIMTFIETKWRNLFSWAIPYSFLINSWQTKMFPTTCYGRRLMIQWSWVRIPAPYTGWTFFTYLFVLKFVMCVWKGENKWKRGRVGPF